MNEKNKKTFFDRVKAAQTRLEGKSDAELLEELKLHEEYDKYSLWKKIWISMTVRGSDAKASKVAFGDDSEVPWNIYTTSPDAKETNSFHAKRFWSLHAVLKYRIIVPLLHVVERYTKKHYTGVADFPYNRNIKLFEEAWEEAIDDWYVEYIRHCYHNRRTYPKWYWKARSRKDSGRLLQTMKELCIMMAQNDTAYREFINIFMFKAASKMNVHYKDKGYEHLFLVGDSARDVTYYYIFRCLENREKLGVYMTSELPCCERMGREEQMKSLEEKSRMILLYNESHEVEL